MTIEVVKQFKISDTQFQILDYELCESLNPDVIRVRYLNVIRNQIRANGHFFIYKSMLKDNNNLYPIDSGGYVLLLGDNTKYTYLKATTNKYCKFNHSVDFYGGIIPFGYNSSSLDLSEISKLIDVSLDHSTIKPKYSFGIEFETSGGCIPADECLKHGLIPLRDGSINGVEYATIPMRDCWAFPLLKKQLTLLKKYCTFDTSCSMHIHLGDYPQNLKFIYCVYKLFSTFQYELEKVLPQYTFKTEKYKTNKKSYCALLPDDLNIIEFYNYMSCGELHINPTAKTKTLTLPHPMDVTHSRKWLINTRYFAINFINALFYNANKTIEIRFLKPAFNYNYILNWIGVFSTMFDLAKKLCTGLSDICFEEVDNVLDTKTNFSYWWNQYPKIMLFLNIQLKITQLQKYCGDRVGILQFYDKFFEKYNMYGV